MSNTVWARKVRARGWVRGSSFLAALALCTAALAAPQAHVKTPARSVVKPSRAPVTHVRGSIEMPTLSRASLTEPPLEDDSPDDSEEITGRGRLTVKLVSEASEPALVKIRHATSAATLARVQVIPGQPREIQLDGGDYQMLIRTTSGKMHHYFKGAPFTLPSGVDGTVLLSFKPVIIRGGVGESLQEITPAEFGR